MILDLGAHRFDVTHRALVMGVLGVDGTSAEVDRGSQSLDRLLHAAHKLVDDGADCLEVGCVGPGPAGWPALQDELYHLVPLISGLRTRFDLPLSVRTSRAEVLGQCLGHGADVGHDLGGFTDPDYLAVASSFGASVVAKAVSPAASLPPVESLASAEARSPIESLPPADRRSPVRTMPSIESMAGAETVSPARRALAELTARAEVAGVPKERILVESEVDFNGSALLVNRSQHLAELLELGYPLLLSATDHRLLCEFLGTGHDHTGHDHTGHDHTGHDHTGHDHTGNADGRADGDECQVDSAVTAAQVCGIVGGCRVIRTHDVQAGRRVADMMAEILSVRARV